MSARRGAGLRGALLAMAVMAFSQAGRAQEGARATAGAEAGAGLHAAGTSLVVEAPCAASVSLREDPFLVRTGEAGQVAMRAEPDGSGPGLSVADGVVRVGAGCGRRAARLVLRVSPGMGVRLAGDTAWDVGTMGGAVEAALQGGGDAEFGALRVLRLSHAGSGDMRVASVSDRLEATLGGAGDLAVGEASGAAVLRVAGAADISVGTASLDTLEVSGGGGGDVSVAAGRVGRVTATLSGGSDLHLRATVGDARLVASGGSDIDVARVEGTLARVATGGGSVTVDGVSDEGSAAPPRPPSPPSAPGPPPPMPFGAAAATSAGVPGWLAPGLVAGALLVAAGVALRARAARQRRPASLRGGWGKGVAGGARRGAAPAEARSRDPEVAVLQQRLAAVEARVAQVERAVTSEEFELHRGFRDLAG